MMHRRSDQTREAAVVALHPGPSRDFAFANPPLASPEARLAQKEAALLEASIERFADRNGQLADLATAIIVLRAEVCMRASTSKENS